MRSCRRRSAGIIGETSRLRRRIDNLLAMARLEAGKAKPRREPTPPADLFHAVRGEPAARLPVASGHHSGERRLSRRERRSVTRARDSREPDRERASRLATRRAAGTAGANASARFRHRFASKCSTAGRAFRPVSPIRTAICSPARRATSRNADSGWRSPAAWRSRMVERSVSRPRPGGGTVARLDLPAALMPAVVAEAEEA